MKTSYEYISFEELEAKPKTKQFVVKNKTSDFILGYVKWYAPWRRYCFFIDKPGLVFDAECLADIQDFLKNLMLERKYESDVKRLKALKPGLDIASIEGN
ncbi:MAG: hypothetical protein LBK83_15755 [Treponema sp.]|jgi:hypothetical protein|nr:hypothetical protein [Treponema sp.]